MSNKIAQIKTQELESEDGPLYAIMCAINISDLSTVKEFINEVVETIKMHRTASPPTTSLLCISMMGDVDAESIANLIKDHVPTDEILKFYLSQMTMADLIHGTPEGEVINTVSLI